MPRWAEKAIALSPNTLKRDTIPMRANIAVRWRSIEYLNVAAAYLRGEFAESGVF